jgi:hypothetical protein
MKKLIVIGLILLFPTSCFAADVVLRWDASIGATGYKIYKSEDNGVTWGTGLDVGNVTTHTYTNVIETKLVLFRISAYNASVESIRLWSGAWYDHRLKPVMAPTGAGIQ